MYPKLISLLVEDDEVGEGTARINSDVQQLESRLRRGWVDNALISHVSTEGIMSIRDQFIAYMRMGLSQRMCRLVSSGMGSSRKVLTEFGNALSGCG